MYLDCDGILHAKVDMTPRWREAVCLSSNICFCTHIISTFTRISSSHQHQRPRLQLKRYKQSIYDFCASTFDKVGENREGARFRIAQDHSVTYKYSFRSDTVGTESYSARLL